MNEQSKPSNENSSRALTTKTSELPTTSVHDFNIFSESELVAAEAFLKRIIATDKGGIKSINEGIAVMMRSKDLNLPFSTCIEHIHVINGKTGVDVHIVKSLLSRAGVIWECTKDYAPQYQYTDGNTIYNDTLIPDYCVRCKTAKEAEEISKDGIIGIYPLAHYMDLKGSVYNELELSDKCVKAINRAHAIKLSQEGKFPVIRIPAQPIDFVTEYKFTRYKVINGKERILTATSHFSYSDAQMAKLLDKENYAKYPRVMVSTRAFMLGARDIADDLIMGVMETNELRVVENLDVDTAAIEYAEEI